MNNKQTQKIAKQDILSGKTKQETYSNLVEKSDLDETELAVAIQNISSLNKRRKYRVMNIILIILLTLLIIFKTTTGVYIILDKGIEWAPLILIIPVMLILLLLAVYNYMYESYKFLIILSLLATPRIFLSLYEGGDKNAAFIDFSFIAVLILLALYLKFALFPKYINERERYQTDSGETRFRNVIKFED